MFLDDSMYEATSGENQSKILHGLNTFIDQVKRSNWTIRNRMNKPWWMTQDHVVSKVL